MAKTTEPRVVAELGRPETPEETAARKAEASRLHRVRQTFRNLVASLVVCAIGMFLLVVLVPRDDTSRLPEIDYIAAAAQAQPDHAQPLAAPVLPDGWVANGAEIRTGADGVTEWYVGFLVPGPSGEPAEYVGLSQGLDANPTWVAQKLTDRTVTGEVNLDGHVWTAYDHLDLPDEERGNTAYALVLEHDGSTYVVYGSHSAEAVQTVARAITAGFTD
ncbi:DUF4245 domain-containing protein [Pseudoclavibacter chungangensis]|uniref:DUF4245 domain-containing protein n=1 Tax=Pseudoclavibacter chungangensis TaxID=587635 RepID=A0A7J5BU91_9MICO|nr:DUF4245 domain-containing protein [Pseudoclavibacter chungangensis]KAB1657917.1 DUF4245 domain-containing protein [Pseudoclavibacter chungangensis]NYJ65937.1 hypothetical protein [Pseudoclavibacter chungangensis]